jgi:hypothetical protein
VFLRQNDHGAATRTVADQPTRLCDDWETAYNIGCILSRSAPIAEKDTRLPEDKRRELARSYAERAIERLGTAVQKGFQDPDALKKDKDFDAIRGRSDFQKIAQELENRARRAKANK